MRRAWLKLHLWLGLLLGLWLSLIGVTGALLVFHYELREMLQPQLFTVAERAGGQDSFRPLAEIEAAAIASLPAGARLGFAYYPRTDAGAYWLMSSVPADGGTDDWQVFVNPYTAEVLGRHRVKAQAQWLARDFFTLVFELHYQLLLPWEIGGPVVGVVALLALGSLAAGVYLWWPRQGKWRRALTLKRRSSAQRLVFDLHNLSGVYLLPVFLAVLLSGIYFNLPGPFFAAVRLFSPGTENRYTLQSHRPAPDAPAIGLQRALSLARERFPEGRPDWLYSPAGTDGVYTICSKQVASVSAFADRRCVTLDQYSGETLWVTAPGVHSGGNTFVAWQWPLHSGAAFGLAGRILVLLSGLALPVLFVTGVIRWRQKVRAQRIVSERRSTSARTGDGSRQLAMRR